MVCDRSALAGFLAQYFWVTCLFSGRTYYLQGSAGEPLKVKRWDPGSVARAVTSLISPVTVVLLATPWRESGARNTEPDSCWLFYLLLTWACGCVNYVTLILAHRSEVVRKIEREAQYAKAVDDRAAWMMRSRSAERERFEKDRTLPATNWKDILKPRDVSPTRVR